MSRGGQQYSPLSASSNDLPYGPRFPGSNGAHAYGGTVNDAPYSGGPYGAAQPRPLRKSPPSSQHPSSSTDMSRPSHGGSSVGGGRPPSSASSVTSNGRMGFGNQRDSARSAVNPHNEDALQRHYVALQNYLSLSLQDDQGKVRPNRARDKLLRLSVTQFMELSTDVYDELIRREDDRLQRIANVPRSLPPKNNFHPKRNQARQKLSTLPIERFRQLATDVFYELERRIPRFAAGDMDRPRSGASSRAPSRGGMRPPPPGAIRTAVAPIGGPMSPAGPNGMGPPRPLPRTFQANTMVPNKSTMVEDDDNEEEDEFGLDNVVAGLARRDTNVNGDMQAMEAEIEDLKQKLLEREQELQQAKQQDIGSLREELEQKHLDAQKLNDDLRREIDQLHKDKNQDEREIRAQHDRNLDDFRTQLDNAHKQLDDLHGQLDTHQSENRELRMQLQEGAHQPSDSEMQRRIELLERELANQEKITKEVRDEATMLLHEMRDLSKQNDAAIEQEEKLAAQVSKLEKEIDGWRHRYVRLKAQNKSLRASHIGLQNSFDGGSLSRQEALISENGLVKDVDVTRFQLSVEELLKVARQSSTESMLDTVKNVAICVQAITSVVGTDGYPTPSSPLSPENGSRNQSPSVAKLKARVTGTANSLITQTKLHASASGLSPVALLDAAASNLTAAVVELIKAVGIKPSPKSDLEDIIDTEGFSNHTQQPSDHQNHYNNNTRDQRSGHLDPHESMGSFYEDHLSDADQNPFQHDEDDDDPRTPREDIMSVSPHLHQQQYTPTVEVHPPESRGIPPPLGGIGRNNTFKKMNGWFGWGSKANTPEPPATPVTPLAPTVDAAGAGPGMGVGYDSYQ